MSQEHPRRDRYATQDLDELQRGSESPITLETMEGIVAPSHGERREIPVPHPGERPGAVRADRSPAARPPSAQAITRDTPDQEPETAQ